ncbi:type II toxin-antitoxin system RelE/ParE family toxin [Euzebya sp.]|uniref:type II toxin-antitoxin system RelE/ParE family toxin n=1 Tax=Euzebya sp. TaxID=1971409 RepID=UPI00351186E4
MARVELAAAAVEDLTHLTAVLSLPQDTTDRVRRSLEPLADFPRLGAELGGRWAPVRFILGPWRWMLILYTYEEEADRVVIVTIQDARSGSAARG